MAGTGVAKSLSDIHTVRNYFFSFLVAGKERILLGGSSSLLRAVKKSLIHLFLCKTSSSVPNCGIWAFLEQHVCGKFQIVWDFEHGDAANNFLET